MKNELSLVVADHAIRNHLKSLCPASPKRMLRKSTFVAPRKCNIV